MFLFLFLVALAQEPTPRGVGSVEDRESPVLACRGGLSGGHTASVLTDGLIALYRQLAREEAPMSCGGYTVEPRSGYRVCTALTDGTSKICTDSSGTTVTSECMGHEAALREQVRRLEACPGITPAPRSSGVSERHTNN